MTVLDPHLDRQPDAEACPAAARTHPDWCVHHHPQGCLGAPSTLPGSGLRVWLWAPSAGDARLVVDGPCGYGELPVDA